MNWVGKPLNYLLRQSCEITWHWQLLTTKIFNVRLMRFMRLERTREQNAVLCTNLSEQSEWGLLMKFLNLHWAEGVWENRTSRKCKCRMVPMEKKVYRLRIFIFFSFCYKSVNKVVWFEILLHVPFGFYCSNQKVWETK